MPQFQKQLANLLCMSPHLEALNAEEIDALHKFKHQVRIALGKLYEKVSPEKIDPLLLERMREFMEEAASSNEDD